MRATGVMEPVKGPGTALGASAVNPAYKDLHIAIVHTQWNPRVVGALVEGATAELRRQGALWKVFEVRARAALGLY